jgi:hypothetical protein
MFNYCMDGSSNLIAHFNGSNSTQFSIGMKPTISFTPAVTLTGSLGLSFAIDQSNVLLNSTSPLTYTLSNTGQATINNWALSSAATSGTVTVSPASGTNLLQSTTVSPSPTGTYSAPGTVGTYAITATASSTDNGVNPVTSTVNVNVGSATAAPGGTLAATATYGTPLSGVVATNGSFKNLSAVVNGVTPGSLGTVVTLLDGTASATTTVDMAFRTRATDEIPATATEPPMVSNGQWLASDVLNLTGITRGTPYVLQMSFDTALWAPGHLLSNFESDEVWLGAYSPGGVWQNAVSADAATGEYAQTQYYGTYAQLLAAVQAVHPTATVADLVGSWGMDASGNAWSVIDYDSDPYTPDGHTYTYNFGVVPEPGTFVLLLAGALALLPVIRRRLKRA